MFICTIMGRKVYLKISLIRILAELESFFKGANTWARIIEKLKFN